MEITKHQIKDQTPSRLLDSWAAEYVMGWPHIANDEPYRYHKDKGGVIVDGKAAEFPLGDGTIPHNWAPSFDMNNTLGVIEAMKAKGYVYCLSDNGNTVEPCWDARFVGAVKEVEDKRGMFIGSYPQVATVKAALLALLS